MEENKMKMIMDCWTQGTGVFVSSGFHSSTHMEAFYREACVIQCIGLDNLTNKNQGYCANGISNWDDTKINNYGLLTIYVLYINAVNEGLKCIHISDIQRKKVRTTV